MATEYASAGDDFQVVRIDRAFGGARTVVLKVSGTTGKVTGLNGVPVLSGSPFFIVVQAGKNGVGALTLTGVNVGDKVIGVMNMTTPGDLKSSFEATITVKNQIQQTAATNLSAAQVQFIIVKQS